jgi:hypothetical protein
MKAIETQIDIRADAAAVWDVLTDFAAYEAWNPFLRAVVGPARQGARLRVRVEPPGQRPVTVRPRIVQCQPGRELRWVGRVVMPGIFDGTHSFRIAACGVGVRFYQGETYGGLAAPLFQESFRLALKAGFVAMNEALCQRAEALFAARRAVA